MEGPIFDLLGKCIARIVLSNGNGTGFFVGPSQLLTCMHVLDPVKDNLDQVRVEYGGEKYVPKILKSLPGPYPDLVLLHVDVVGHPCVFLDPVLDPGESLYVYGFTTRYPAGEPSTVEYEGPAMLDPSSELLKFKGGQIVPGLSGAPLLNMSTWSVAGIVKSTRDRASDLGGGGIPAKVILKSLPELVSIQQMFHNWDRRWLIASQKQRERKTVDARPTLVVSIVPAQAPKRSSCVEVDESRIPSRTILDKLWCPQSLAWFAPSAIALGSRDSVLRIGAPDGRIVAEYPVPESYPSDVTVHASLGRPRIWRDQHRRPRLRRFHILRALEP
ncbi:MAG: serine protease [Pseudomonadota bacterium]|nr:serine protease [Pseudomonadota bacterium]